MRQTTLCVPLDVKPESCSRLSALVEQLCQDEDTGHVGELENFGLVAREIPTLHFMSMSVFTATAYDPIFILEANFDGSSGVFWGQMEALFGERLREILRCCKKPLDNDATLYDAVTMTGSRAPIAPYLEARTQRPSVYHHGNRGLTRDRVLAEAKLFSSMREELDNPARGGVDPYRGISASELHTNLRDRMRSIHPWLDEAVPERITVGERITDGLNLLAFGVVLLLALSLPGIAVAMALSTTDYLIVVACATAFILVWIYRKSEALPGTKVPTSFNLGSFLLRKAPLIAAGAVVAILSYALIATVLLIPFVILLRSLLEALGGHETGSQEAFWPVARVVLLGLLSILVTAPAIVLWLRYLEQRDPAHDAPHVDERLLREMVRREDWIAQNHMGSVVLIKPGVLRSVIIRAGHLGLGLVLRVVATDGYLGSMRTVHFAHWAFLNNGSRLLFFSNFDHSWDSYLDDFIEKAHGGLTLAWGCGVGFPATRFLILDGASHGRQFKTWALASRAVSRFWYSAYPTLTVDQIERNNRIVDGLRRSSMDEEEARRWARDL